MWNERTAEPFISRSSHLSSLFMWMYWLYSSRKLYNFSTPDILLCSSDSEEECQHYTSNANSVNVDVIFNTDGPVPFLLCVFCVCVCACVHSCAHLFFPHLSGRCYSDEYVPTAFQWKSLETLDGFRTFLHKAKCFLVFFYKNKSKCKILNTYLRYVAAFTRIGFPKIKIIQMYIQSKPHYLKYIQCTSSI